MPSKRTNDSVDEILQEVSREQNAAGLQASVTDHQIDEILRSVGIAPDLGKVGLPLDDAYGAAPQPKRQAPARQEAPRTARRPVQPEPPQAAPRPAAMPQAERFAMPEEQKVVLRPEQNAAQAKYPVQPEAEPQSAFAEDPLGDTTRTGIIKGFLQKMAPEGSDSEALDLGKTQFKKFFKDSVAVVPDEKGHIREPGRKKRGWFGLKRAEDTDEFVPINVSLAGGHSAPQHPEEEDTQPEPQPSAEKKTGFWGGIFAPPASQTEELVIPESRVEPELTQPTEPELTPDEPTMKNVWRSKYSRDAAPQTPAAQPMTDTWPTLRAAAVQPEAEQGSGTGSTVYRKKRNTVEFVPRRRQTAPPAAPQQELVGEVSEPVGEPLSTGAGKVTSGGFSVRMDLSEMEQPAFTPEPAPVQPEMPHAAHRGTPASAQRSGFTQQISLPETETFPPQPAAPAQHSGFTQQISLPGTETFPPRPADPVQQIDLAGPREPGTGEFLAQAWAASGAKPGAAPVQHSGFTQEMDPALPQDSTQEFMAAYAQARSRRTARQQPAPQPAVQPEVQPQRAPGLDGDTIVVPIAEKRTRDEVDELVDTLTGTGKLAPAEPQQPYETPYGEKTYATEPYAEPIYTETQVQVDDKAPTQDLAPGKATGGFTMHLGEEPQPGVSTETFMRSVAQSMGVQPDRAPKQPAPRDEQTFDDAAARLMDTAEEEPQRPARSGKTLGIRLGGVPDDEQEEPAAPFADERPAKGHKDYERAEDAPEVAARLEKRVMQYTVAAGVSAAAAAILLILGLMGSTLPAMPGPLADPGVLPGVALVLLAAACAAGWQTLRDGVLGLWKRPTADTLTVLPLAGALVQLVVALANAKTYDPRRCMLMAGPAVLVLCMNSLGHRLDAISARDAFRLVSAKVDHAVAYRLRDAAVLRTVTRGLAEPRPNVLVSRPTPLLKNYLASCDAPRTSDKNQQQFAWVLGAAALLGLVVSLLFQKQDAVTAVTGMATVLCLGAPLAGTLISALPARSMQRGAAQVGAVVPGWRDIRQLGRINVVQVTARDLFPNGCVSLCGIKPVKPEHIDLAIVYAASILAEAGPTLRDLFLGMLESKDLLATVEDRETVYGKGYIGWIRKRRVLVGNRALMLDHGVKVPSLEYEQSHTVNQRRVIYLAVSGKLFAMFQVAYQRDPDTAAVLDQLRNAGISLLVDGDDFNCDVALLETAYSLPGGSVKVLDVTEREALASATAWLPESEGNMLHLGSFASFVGGWEVAAGAAEGERRASVVLTVSVLFSSLLGLLLSFTGGVVTLPLPAIVLYQAAWAVLALLFPVTQRY